MTRTSPARPAPVTRRRAGGTASPGPAPRSTPTAGARSPPTCSAAAAGRPGPVRSRRTESLGVQGFPRSRCATRSTADVAALAALGITEVAAVVGGSMGGARALEWIDRPPRHRAVGAGARGRGPGDRRPDRHPEHADRRDQGRPGLAGRRLLRHRTLTRRRHGDRPPVRAPDLPRRGRAGHPVRQRRARATRIPTTGGRYAVQSYLEYQGAQARSRGSTRAPTWR